MAVPAMLSEVLAGQSEWEHRDSFPPGPQLAVVLSAAGDDIPADADLLAAARAARRQIAWAASRELAALAALSERRHAEAAANPCLPSHRMLNVTESLVEEISLALGVTSTAAARLLQMADRLAADLPQMRALLEGGQISVDHVRILCDALVGLPVALIPLLEAAVAPDAPDMTTGQFRHRIKAVLKALDPDGFAERSRTTSQRSRRLEQWDNGNGTADLALCDLPAEQISAIYNKISAVAAAMRADGDVRSLDQLRADLATALLQGTTLPDAARVLLTASAATAAPAADAAPPAEATESAADAPASARPADAATTGEADSAATRGCTADATPGDATSRPSADITRAEPATPGAVRPLPRDAARRNASREISDVPALDPVQAADTQLARALARVVDQQLTSLRERARNTGQMDQLARLTGRAVQRLELALAGLRDDWCQATGPDPDRHGHDGYKPPAAMQRLIQRRHPRCVFPTCNQPVERCDIDHTRPYDQGGRTCRCNLAPLCRRHHRSKQTRRWKLFQVWPGLLIWITPSGTWHIVMSHLRP